MINVNNTPLYRAVLEYSNSKPVPFHMPGHKLGRGLPKGPLADIGLLDLTEIPGTDNLHFPEGVIKEAQQLAAEAFGADESFFLVNGSTVGVLAAIMSVCKQGDKLIISRDCHKSVINAVLLAGAIPVYIRTGFNKEFGIPTGAEESEIEAALEQNPDSVGVFITRPNYYGVCCDIKSIACKVHSGGKILIVDEAHGTHFRFCKELPASAMEAGADISIQSAHKTLPALTQTAFLHVKGELVDRERLKFYLRLLQTSSPSYILMASLDASREIMVSRGEELLYGLLEMIRGFNEAMKEAEGLAILEGGCLEDKDLDGTRLVINSKGIGQSGFFLEKVLRQKYNIQVEMADLYNIVCITTIADSRCDFKRLGDAMIEMSRDYKGSAPLTDIHLRELSVSTQAVNLRDIISCNSKNVRLKDAVGKASSGMITPYPPGIPVVCPGEIITADAVEYLYNIVEAGGVVNGLTGDMEISVVC